MPSLSMICASTIVEADVGSNTLNFDQAKYIILLEDHSNPLHRLFNARIVDQIIFPTEDMVLLEERSLSTSLTCLQVKDVKTLGVQYVGWDHPDVKNWTEDLHQKNAKTFQSIQILKDIGNLNKNRKVPDQIEALSYLIAADIYLNNYSCSTIEMWEKELVRTSPLSPPFQSKKESLIQAGYNLIALRMKSLSKRVFGQRQEHLIKSLRDWSHSRKIFAIAGIQHGDLSQTSHVQEVINLIEFLKLTQSPYMILNPGRFSDLRLRSILSLEMNFSNLTELVMQSS